jgi:hypothetical protein
VSRLRYTQLGVLARPLTRRVKVRRKENAKRNHEKLTGALLEEVRRERGVCARDGRGMSSSEG